MRLVLYVACATGLWFDPWLPKFFFFRQFFFGEVFFFARRLQNGFFDPYSDPIRSHTIHSDIQRFLRSFDRIWKARRKHIFILQIHKSIIVFFFFYGTRRSRRLILQFTSDRMNDDCTFICLIHPSPLTYEENKDKTWKFKFFSDVLFHYSNLCLVLEFTIYFLSNAKNALC